MPEPPRPQERSLAVARWTFVAAGAALVASVAGAVVCGVLGRRTLGEPFAFTALAMAVVALAGSIRYVALTGGRRRRTRGPAAYPERPCDEPYWARPLVWIVLCVSCFVLLPVVALGVIALLLSLR